jgi:hypothetical protein
MRSRLYFEEDGVAYRVHDVKYSARRNQRVPLGDTSANYRVFVPQDGPRRAYKFRPNEQHAVTESELAQQLRASEYLPTKSFNADELTPGKRPG